MNVFNYESKFKIEKEIFFMEGDGRGGGGKTRGEAMG